MVDPDQVNQAKQGDPEAIAALISQSLQTDGVRARAQRDGHHLQIMLESAIPLDQAQVMPRIQQGMTRLAIPDLHHVKVYSKRTDSEFPDWSATLALPKPLPTNPAIAPSPDPSAAISPLDSSSQLAPGEDRLFALLAHLGPLLGYLLWLGSDSLFWVWGSGSVWLVGRIGLPLIVFLTKGKNSPFVKAQAKEALNFQISMLLYWMGVVALFFLLIGFLLIIPLALFELICVIVAAAKVGDRQQFRYPLNLRLIK